MNHSEDAKNLFHKRADLYQEKYMDVSAYAEGLDLFCEQIKAENPQILELACGPGNITRYLMDKRPDFKILGIDFAPNMIELAKQNVPEAEFLAGDVRNISELNRNFDGIVCGFCLPYLNLAEVEQLIANAHRILNEKGLFYLSLIEDQYENSRYQTSSQGEQLFQHYYSEQELTTLLHKGQFKLRYIHRQEFSGNPPGFDLMMIAEKCS